MAEIQSEKIKRVTCADGHGDIAWSKRDRSWFCFNCEELVMLKDVGGQLSVEGAPG